MSKRDYRKPAPPGQTWVRFGTDCIHCGLPFKAGDEIIVDDHWADSIERIGSGRRIVEVQPPAKGKE